MKPPSLQGMGFSGGSDGKEPACSAEDVLIPGLGRFPGEGNGNSFQCSYLENPMDREPGRLQSMESQSQTQLSTHTAGKENIRRHPRERRMGLGQSYPGFR